MAASIPPMAPKASATTKKQGETEVSTSDRSDFAQSMLFGLATDNAAVGALMGGDILGGVVGESLNG